MPGRGPRLAASYKIAWHNEGELELGYIRTCLRHMGGAGAGDHGNGPGARRGHKNQRGKVPQPQTLPSYKTRNSSTVGAQRLWTRAMILGRAPGEASQDKGQTATESTYPIWPGVPLPLLFPFVSLGCHLTGLRAPWLMLKLSLQVLTLHGHKVYLCLMLPSLGSLHCFAQMLGARLRPGSPLRSWPLFALICAGCLRSRSIGSLHPSSSQLKPPLCALLWSPC